MIFRHPFPAQSERSLNSGTDTHTESQLHERNRALNKTQSFIKYRLSYSWVLCHWRKKQFTQMAQRIVCLLPLIVIVYTLFKLEKPLFNLWKYRHRQSTWKFLKSEVVPVKPRTRFHMVENRYESISQTALWYLLTSCCSYSPAWSWRQKVAWFCCTRQKTLGPADLLHSECSFF